MNTYFISDLHLQESDKESTRLFLYFINQHAIHADALYILGDFFEYWIGDDALTPFHEKIIAAFTKLNQHNVPVYFMHGNRDFLIAKKFAQLAKCELLKDPTLITLDNHNILLSHGDMFCTLDREYQRYRSLSRNKLVQWLFTKLPLTLRYKTAKYLRGSHSRKFTKIQADPNDNKFSIIQKDVEQAMLKNNTEILIHGHTHAPKLHEFTMNDKIYKRIVLGSWDSRAYILNYSTNNDFQLQLIKYH